MTNSRLARWSYDFLMKKLLGSVVALASLVALAPAANAAELKYTMHMEAKPAANAASDPMSAMLGGLVTQMFPPGGLDQVVIAGDQGLRSEQRQDMGDPEGLQRSSAAWRRRLDVADSLNPPGHG